MNILTSYRAVRKRKNGLISKLLDMNMECATKHCLEFMPVPMCERRAPVDGYLNILSLYNGNLVLKVPFGAVEFRAYLETRILGIPTGARRLPTCAELPAGSGGRKESRACFARIFEFFFKLP
ncbi:hypothetical protein B0H14DRAFT_2567580 [Mycena olivaceomarginata]|nr:hypothetical protein B0H14DRAFT_2567580 [Mycena olivaceomarginata]